MNGISSNLQDEIKKTSEAKKKVKFKFITSIILSNFMVAILCLPSKEENPSIVKSLSRPRHPGFQMIVLPANVLLSPLEQDKKEVPVTLSSSENKILVQKAYLHEEIHDQKDALSSEENLKQFNIEIPNESIVAISDFSQTGVIVLPHIEQKTTSKIHRGSKYEISF